MAARKPVDEWGVVIQQQAEVLRQKEAELNALSKQARSSYRTDLESQHQMTELKKEYERILRAQEAREVQSKVQSYQDDVQKRKLEDVNIKRQLADAYSYQSSLTQQQQQSEIEKKRREEEAHLQRVKQLAEDEAARRREERLAQTQQEQMVIQFKRQQEELKRQQAEQEKLYDRQLAEEYARREEEKERKYRAFYAQKDQDNSTKQQIYTKEVARVESNRRSEIADWQQRNETEYQRRLAEKDERERQLKLQSQAMINDTLRAQMEEKEQRRAQERAEYLAQQEEMNARVRANKEYEQRLAAERKAQQYQYREHLALQSNIKSEVTSNAYRLSDKERQLNAGSDPTSLPGVGFAKSALRSNGASIIKPSKTLDQNLAQFYSSTPQQSLTDLTQPLGVASTAQLETNAKAFYGAYTPAESVRGGRLSDPGLEANAKAFFGAYTPSVPVRGSKQAYDPVKTPYDPARASLEANAKAFFGAYTPAVNPRQSLDLPSRQSLGNYASPTYQ